MLDTFSWNLILRSGTTLLQGTGMCPGALSRLCGRNLKGTCAFGWLRGLDLNHRPLGYEPRRACSLRARWCARRAGEGEAVPAHAIRDSNHPTAHRTFPACHG